MPARRLQTVRPQSSIASKRTRTGVHYKKTFTKYSWLNRLLYKNKKMVAVSKAAEKLYKTTYKLNDISTIYNGFNFERTLQQRRAVLVMMLS